MRLVAVFWVAVATTAAAGRADPPQDDRDRMQLQGTWKIVAYEGGADKVSLASGGKLTVTADTVTLAIGDRKESFAYKLDPTKTPKWLDLIADKATVIQCIYQLDGDALRIRFPEGGKERATKFELTKAAPGDRLLTLKRAK